MWLKINHFNKLRVFTLTWEFKNWFFVFCVCWYDAVQSGLWKKKLPSPRQHGLLCWRTPIYSHHWLSLRSVRLLAGTLSFGLGSFHWKAEEEEDDLRVSVWLQVLTFTSILTLSIQYSSPLTDNPHPPTHPLPPPPSSKGKQTNKQTNNTTQQINKNETKQTNIHIWSWNN